MTSVRNLVMLALIGAVIAVPAQAHAGDGRLFAAREWVQQERRDARMQRQAERAKHRAQKAEQVNREGQRPSEWGYGYGYERRHGERVLDRVDRREGR